MGEPDIRLPGTYLAGLSIAGKAYDPGTVFEYSVYLPVAAAKQKTGLALYVLLEYDAVQLSAILEPFIDEGLMPPGLFLFCGSGRLPPTMEGGAERGMRCEEFDQYGREYSDLLVEEIVPDACRAAGVALSPDPDMHFITGGSSGGLCAWNAVWFRNDFFRRTYLSSPTFSAMRGGEEPMVLLRKTEPRPIRIYLTVGTTEPDYFFGSSYYAACNAAKAFAFAGYDFRFEVFPNEGHCARRSHPALLRRMMTFLWANYATVPVRPLHRQIRLNQLLPGDSAWTATDEKLPPRPASVTTAAGTYRAEGGHIIFTSASGEKRSVASAFGDISALALSSDLWRLYVADRARRFVYAMTIQPDGSLAACYKLAPLHLAHDCRILGASDLCMGHGDRVFAATELGIQGIISFGMVDSIMPLPGDLPADRVVLKGHVLYAASGRQVFKRTMKIAAPGNGMLPVAPSTPGYGDGYEYSIPHLPQ